MQWVKFVFGRVVRPTSNPTRIQSGATNKQVNAPPPSIWGVGYSVYCITTSSAHADM